MHVSLDSALGRQRRLNSVGESVLQIAPNAAAAYSLRSLTGGSPKVVRVRRASDNGERDFTSAEINSGEMVSWVNQQAIAPLDIQALEADGRTGDFLIAKAAYSLRSLGTRQATLAATGDTVARANGKFVAQVRRSSDDALKSFTADEVTDGTLRNFCLNDDTDIISFADAGLAGSPAANKRMYFDGANDRVESNTTVDESSDFFIKTNVVWLGNRDEVIFSDRGSSERLVNAQVHSVDDKVKVQVQTSAGFSVLFFSTADLPKFQVIEVMLQHTASTKTLELFFDGVSQGSGNYTGTSTPANRSTVEIGSETNGSRLFNGILSDFNYNNETIQLGYGNTNADWEDTVGSNNGTVEGSPALFTGQGFDGFVKTWYDQSVTNEAGDTATGNHATQATAASQPKIVSAGALNTDGIDFDGTDDIGLVTGSFSLTQTYSTFSVSHTDDASTSQGIWSTAASFDSNFNATQLFRNDNGFAVNSGATLSTAGTINYAADRNYLQTNVVNGGSSSIFVDGATGATGNMGSTNPSGVLILGYYKSGATKVNLDGAIKELIIYDSDQTANRTAIEANVGETYSITGIPAYDNEVDGFVETWYDQSGNGRDAVQATASLQPKIVNAGSYLGKITLDGADDFFNTSITPNTTNGFFVILTELHSLYNFNTIFDNDANSNIWEMWSYSTGQVATRSVDADFRLNASSTITANTKNLITLDYISSRADLYINGTSVASDTSRDIGASSPTTLNIGAGNSGNTPTDASFYELILYDTDQTANRVAIETNINSEYSIF